MARGKKRGSSEINASSMADIAFLLLIFFLVTTTINADKGITVKLPPWTPEDEQVDIQLKTRNVFSVMVNKFDQLQVKGDLTEITDLKKKCKEFIINPNNDPKLSERPTKAVVSIRNDRGTSYEMYISVYNELKAAYNEIYEEECMKRYGVSYKTLDLKNPVDLDRKKAIKKDFPLIISEAEPEEIK